MQTAAEARIPFIVIDRPNPLVGKYMSGFVLENGYRSCVGEFPIHKAHGLTASELTLMIKEQRMTWSGPINQKRFVGILYDIFIEAYFSNNTSQKEQGLKRAVEKDRGGNGSLTMRTKNACVFPRCPLNLMFRNNV